MDFGEVQFGNGDSTKERRSSFVHDVDPSDNQVSYGQPDNQAINTVDTMRIASVDDDTDQKGTSRGSVHSNQSDENDDSNANVFIHENVDNNYEDFGNEQITDDYSQTDTQTRGSKEATPDKANAKTANDNTFDTSHYRHPSLAPNENPASDEEDLDKDHGRYLSTLIHENVDSDEGSYEMTPSEQVLQSESHFKNISRLNDYWCHSSAGIAIEDDTDANNANNSEYSNGHNIKGSIHDINDYTRPFMSKIYNNQRWDTVFGNGIISDTHSKYVQQMNGHFIEWIIEINNLYSNQYSKVNKSTAIIGVSSDLLGETNTDSFVNVAHGFGFDNLGNILNNNETVSNNKDLHFGARDVVHIILDYSKQNNWTFYAKVGDIEEEDYSDLKAAAETKKIATIFEKMNPGSYRLAVSVFSQMDSLVIESCKIHGKDTASFYQELKSYSMIEKEMKGITNEMKDTLPSEEESKGKESQDTKESTVDSSAMRQEDEEEKVIESIKNDDSQTVDEAKNDSVTEEKKEAIVIEEFKHDIGKQEIKEDIDVETSENKGQLQDPNNGFVIEVSPAPNSDLLRVDSSESVDHNTLHPLNSMKSVIIHTDESDMDSGYENDQNESDRRIISQQLSQISALKSQISQLKKESKQRQSLIEIADKKEKKHTELMREMENTLREYKRRAQASEESVTQLGNDLSAYKMSEKSDKQSLEKEKETLSAKITAMSSENGRLSHELKLAQDRVKSLNAKKTEMQSKLNQAIESKMNLIKMTAEEIDHYRELIQRIAQNKLGCQLLSEFSKIDSNNNNHSNRNGYH